MDYTIRMMNKFLKENYPNTVAISTDELGNNSEVSMPEMLEKHRYEIIKKEMKTLSKLKTILEVRKYIKESIIKK